MMKTDMDEFSRSEVPEPETINIVTKAKNKKRCCIITCVVILIVIIGVVVGVVLGGAKSPEEAMEMVSELVAKSDVINDDNDNTKANSE